MQTSSGVETVEAEQDILSAEATQLCNHYQYEPLAAEDAVRILILEPADHFESPLRCSITQRRRETQSCSASGCEYSAVSYTWGDCELSHQLLVTHDAQSWSCLQITASVDSLLRHFRVPYKPILLWIDAICLNQKDETEKTQQIPVMGQIYSDAERVHIWLGENEIEEAQRAYSILRRVEVEEKVQVDEGEVLCLKRFFNRPWFTRRWVIQETVFSHDALFHCGIYTLSLSRVMSALRKIKSVGERTLESRGVRMLLSSVGVRQTSQKGLLDLLWDLHESECSDPRDRIAAIYTLASGPAWALRQYNPNQWGEMYMDAASYYISTGPAGSFAVLSHLYDFGPIKPGTYTQVPSWVPDWSARRQERLSDARVTFMVNLSSEEHYRMHEKWAGKMQLEWRRLLETFTRGLQWWSSREEEFHLREMGKPSLMALSACGRRLRLDYHSLAFFDQCGTVKRVICPSTTSTSWQGDLWKGVPRFLSANILEELFKDGSLFMLLARILAEEDKAAHNPSKNLEHYAREILEARDYGQSDTHTNILRRISSSLRHSAMVQIEAVARSYWAIGPQNSLAGDWVVPLLQLKETDVVSMLCLRPTGSTSATPPGVWPGASVRDRLRYFFSRKHTAEVDRMNVAAKFIGPARDYSQRTVYLWDEDMWMKQEKLRRAAEAASPEGLPGPIVFDII